MGVLSLLASLHAVGVCLRHVGVQLSIQVTFGLGHVGIQLVVQLFAGHSRSATPPSATAPSTGEAATATHSSTACGRHTLSADLKQVYLLKSKTQRRLNRPLTSPPRAAPLPGKPPRLRPPLRVDKRPAEPRPRMRPPTGVLFAVQHKAGVQRQRQNMTCRF